MGFLGSRVLECGVRGVQEGNKMKSHFRDPGFWNAGFPRSALGLQKCCTELLLAPQGLIRPPVESMLLGRIPRSAAGDFPTAPWKIIFLEPILIWMPMASSNSSGTTVTNGSPIPLAPQRQRNPVCCGASSPIRKTFADLYGVAHYCAP